MNRVKQLVHAENVYRMGYTGKNIRVVTLDTGVYLLSLRHISYNQNRAMGQALLSSRLRLGGRVVTLSLIHILGRVAALVPWVATISRGMPLRAWALVGRVT